MTPFSTNKIREGNVMNTFKVKGQVYHLIVILLPPKSNNHQFLQIYFLSDQDQIRVRSNIVLNLNIELIGQHQTSNGFNLMHIRTNQKLSCDL